MALLNALPKRNQPSCAYLKMIGSNINIRINRLSKKKTV
jgi:hypothetical protein